MWDPYADFEHFTLENGLNIHKAYWPGRPWEHMGFVIHAGARDDALGLEGTAHFAEHVVSRNTRTSKDKIERLIKSKGGTINFGATSFLGTAYRCSVPAMRPEITKALTYFGDLLFHLQLNQQVEEQREVIRGEHRRDFPTRFSYEMREREHQLLYGGMWNARMISPLGSLGSITAIRKEDLQAFYDQQYVPENTSVVCLGGYTSSELLRLFQKSPFAKGKSGRRNPCPEIITSPSSPSRSQVCVSTSEQFQTSAFDTVARCMATVVLPGNIKPLLLNAVSLVLNHLVFEKVRERKQRSYNPGCSYSNYQSHSTLTLDSGQIDPAHVKEIQEMLLKCFRNFSKTRSLYERYRQERIVHLRMADVSGGGVVRSSIDDLVFYRRIVSLQEILQQMEDLTYEDVLALAPWLSEERILQVSLVP